MKTCKILSMEQSQNCRWIRSYTILYRGREYAESTDLYSAPIYEVGATYICDTYKDKRGNLRVIIHGKKQD